MTHVLDRLKHPSLLAATFALFLLAIVVINPLREMSIDDDWAYALTVRHLLETGQYQLESWLGSNTLFQVGWAALYSLIFGYSLSILRVSTLVLAGIGLLAFYGLAREHDLSGDEAALLTLIWLASPLVLQLSFTFMSDIPFLVTISLALYCYSRGIRLHSIGWMILGSLAAAMAILTRHFGVALVAGLGLTWLLRKDRWLQFPFYTLGLIAPVMALLLQTYVGIVTPYWAAGYVVAVQTAYMKSSAILLNLVWRPMLMLQYLAFYALPLVPLALGLYIQELQQPDLRNLGTALAKLDFWILTCGTLYLLGADLIGAFVMRRPGTFPYLPWILDSLADLPGIITGGLTLITSIGAFLFGRIFLLRYLQQSPDDPLDSSDLLLSFVTLFLVIECLLFVQIGDRYFIPLLPYALIVAGQYLFKRIKRTEVMRIAALLSLVVLVVSMLWIRGTLNYKEAQWQGSEMIRKTLGVPVERISAAWEWEAYNGSFDRYLASLSDPSMGTYNDYFHTWRELQLNESQYVLEVSVPSLDSDPHLVIYDRIPFQGVNLQTHYVNIYKRVGQ